MGKNSRKIQTTGAVTRFSKCPVCDKEYKGSIRTVEKLIKIHNKNKHPDCNFDKIYENNETETNELNIMNVGRRSQMMFKKQEEDMVLRNTLTKMLEEHKKGGPEISVVCYISGTRIT